MRWTVSSGVRHMGFVATCDLVCGRSGNVGSYSYLFGWSLTHMSMFSGVFGAIGVDLSSRLVAVLKSSSSADRCADFFCRSGFGVALLYCCGCGAVVTLLASSCSFSSCPDLNSLMRRLMSCVRDGPPFSFMVGARISCSYMYMSCPAATSDSNDGLLAFDFFGGFLSSFVVCMMSVRRSSSISSSW